MTAPFAAIEARINTAALAQLSNATATIGAVSFDVIFRNSYGEALGFIGGGSPQIACASARVSGVAKNTAVSVDGVAYLVAEIDPDGTGITVLKLEAV